MIEYGLTDVDVFQTVDLWEKKDISAVVKSLYALGREVSASARAPVLFHYSLTRYPLLH